MVSQRSHRVQNPGIAVALAMIRASQIGRGRIERKGERQRQGRDRTTGSYEWQEEEVVVARKKK